MTDDELEQTILPALERLRGWQFRNGGRAADMKMFSFSSPTAPEMDCTIHLQCPWRVVRGDRVVTTAREVKRAIDGVGPRDWQERGGNRADVALFELFDSSPFTVEHVECDGGRLITIECSPLLLLQVHVGDMEGEQWRLRFASHGKSDHLVVERQKGVLDAQWV